jgi:hypothetical protein
MTTALEQDFDDLLNGFVVVGDQDIGHLSQLPIGFRFRGSPIHLVLRCA